MVQMFIVKDTLSDNSVVFDLLIQSEDKSVTIPLSSAAGDEDMIGRKVNEFHEAFEKLLGETVSWGDMLNKNAGW